MIYTGFVGLAALYTGRIDVARGVGRWMRTIMELQPDFPSKLYTLYSRANGLHTKVDPTEELRYVVLSDAKRDQFFFQPGGSRQVFWHASSKPPVKYNGSN